VPELAADKTLQENTSGGRLSSLGFYQAGNFYLSQEKYDQALAAYRSAIQSSLLNLDWGLDARMAVGLAYKDMGSIDRAIETFQEIPNTISSVTEPYLELARIYQDQGEPEAALQLYDQPSRFTG
jgi:tetratricopeptide (TPR) repeat protein